MTSKVLANIPNVQFQSINKKRQDVVGIERSNLGLTSSDPVVRANQLEQNLRFLQDQHQIMLAGLHGEVETLRQRNRDLQFQLVFSKGGLTVLQGSLTSSPEDETQRKILLSPGQVNITPLQTELLERDVAELRTNLSEARTRNVYLQGVVDDQKKRLAGLENERLDLAAVGKKIGKENVVKMKPVVAEGDESRDELREKLEDADRLIRRLRRENEEQRKEIVSLRASMSRTLAENRRAEQSRGERADKGDRAERGDRGEGGTTYRNYYRNSQNQQTSRFPPLHPQGYWNYGAKNCSEYQPNRERGGNRLERDSEVVGRPAPMLPHLRDRNNASTSTGYSNPAYNHYQGGSHKRGHHFHRKQDGGGNRTSRGYHREPSYQQPEKE